ncbi:hypothetical protein IWX90DRAFT_252753 [Phyllosticta citrichinensis]|uniref:DUF7721 domain-containing protein n=1 Tax=Phyllosticta citrichinensis TaxID=1130410 RepID=A0ABR1XRU7_9PEZI
MSYNDEYSRRGEGGYGREEGHGRSEGGYGREESYGRSEGGYGHSTGTSYGGGARYDDDDDFSSAAEHASKHSGSSGDHSLFSQALGMLSGKKSSLAQEDVDEEDAVRQHKRMYTDEGNGHEATSDNIGAAAAMQALKHFSGGSGGSGGKTEYIGTAMSLASQLFDQQQSSGKAHSSATKQDAVQSAAQMALKMYMKSEMGGSSGGSSSGGGLMKLAGKFL